MSCDPALKDGFNLYLFCKNNPITNADSDGKQSGEEQRKIIENTLASMMQYPPDLKLNLSGETPKEKYKVPELRQWNPPTAQQQEYYAYMEKVHQAQLQTWENITGGFFWFTWIFILKGFYQLPLCRCDSIASRIIH
jgi:hypothetical protein